MKDPSSIVCPVAYCCKTRCQISSRLRASRRSLPGMVESIRSRCSAPGRAPWGILLQLCHTKMALPPRSAVLRELSLAHSYTILADGLVRDFSYSTTISTVNFFGSSAKMFAGCISTLGLGSETTVAGRSGQTTNVTSITGPVTMWGQPLTVLFQQNDLALFGASTSEPPVTSTSSETMASATATPSPTPEAQASSTLSTITRLSVATTAPTDTNNSIPPNTTSISPAAESATIPAESRTTNGASSTGVSAGAGAGIGIGACAALVMMGAAFLILWRRRRRKQVQTLTRSPPAVTRLTKPHSIGPSKQNAMEVDGKALPVQLHADPARPFGSDQRPAELSSSPRWF